MLRASPRVPIMNATNTTANPHTSWLMHKPTTMHMQHQMHHTSAASHALQLAAVGAYSCTLQAVQ
jgi:hypothetical protein